MFFQQGGVFTQCLLGEQVIVACLGDNIRRCLPVLAKQLLLITQVIIVIMEILLPGIRASGLDVLHQVLQPFDHGLRPWHAAGDIDIHGQVMPEHLGRRVTLPVHAAVDRAGTDADDIFWCRHLLICQNDALQGLDRYITGNQQNVGLPRRHHGLNPQALHIETRRHRRWQFDRAAAGAIVQHEQGTRAAEVHQIIEHVRQRVAALLPELDLQFPFLAKD